MVQRFFENIYNHLFYANVKIMRITLHIDDNIIFLRYIECLFSKNHVQN